MIPFYALGIGLVKAQLMAARVLGKVATARTEPNPGDPWGPPVCFGRNLEHF
jgi:hypothetical protein